VVHHGMAASDMLGALMGRVTKPEMGAE
jgi:hypothetical protein